MTSATARADDAPLATADTAAATELKATEVTLADVIRERALMLGAGSTVLNQLADLPTGLGVAEHSTTLARPVDRLRTTLLFVYVAVCGTDAEREQVRKLVNKAHAPVRSQGRYSAYDPELQLWVAATLAHNAVSIYERVFGPLDDASRQRLYQESQIFGTMLQVRPEQWPPTPEAFERYWQEKLGTLASDPKVQVYAQRLLSPARAPYPLRPLLMLQSFMARGTVEPAVREALGLIWTPQDQRRYDLFWSIYPAIYRRIPRPIRHLSAHAVLLDTRLRMSLGRRVI